MIVAAGAMSYENSWEMLGFEKTKIKEPGISCISAEGLVRIAAGLDHSMFLYENGTLKALGSNRKRQLGFSEKKLFGSPIDIQVEGETTFQDMDCDCFLSVVATKSGKLFVFGKLTSGDKVPVHELVVPSPAIAVRMVNKIVHVVDEYGTLSMYHASDGFCMVKHSFASPVIDIGLGSEGYVALCSDGSVWGAGKFFTDDIRRWRRVESLNGKHVIQVAAEVGPAAYAALCDDGSLYICGENMFGELGFHNGNKVRDFERAATDVVDVSMGANFTVIVKKDGSAWASGMDNAGQLLVSRSETAWQYTSFTRCELVAASVASVRCGKGSSTFLLVNSDPLTLHHLKDLNMKLATKRIFLEDGYQVSSDAQPSIYSCGQNEFGQLGHEGTAMTNLSLDASAVRDICAGAEHTVVHLTTGIVLAFGCDQRFQIGLGGGGCYVSPVMVKIGEEDTFYTVTCGPYYTAYVPASNRNVVVLCSSMSVGQPTYFVCESPVLQLYAGPEYPAAIDCNGDLWTFVDGQSRKVHFNVPLWDVFVGNGFIFAITSEGQLYGNSWLHNSETAPDEFCQLEDVPDNLYARVLGHGDQAVFIMRDGSAYRFTPPEDHDLRELNESFKRICDGVIDGACGRDHIVLVKQNGDVCTFGSNDHGQVDSSLSSLHCVGLVCCGVENTFALMNSAPRVLSTSIFDPKGCLEDFAPLAREKRANEGPVFQEKKSISLQPLESIEDLASLALALQQNTQTLQQAFQAGDIDGQEWNRLAQEMNKVYLEKMQKLAAKAPARDFVKEIQQATITKRPAIMQEAMQYYVGKMQSGAITMEQFQQESAKLTAALSVPAPP